MKNKDWRIAINYFFIITLLSIIISGCVKKSERRTQKGEYEVEFIFEHDGCKIYRFHDGNKLIYYWNCNKQEI